MIIFTKYKKNKIIVVIIFTKYKKLNNSNDNIYKIQKAK